MEKVLALIEKKKQEFAKSGLFEFMRDKSIDPRQRLAFAPCIAPFAMSFGEFNKYVFREEPTNDPLQAIVNTHTYEDDHHWLWFLEDLETLGINRAVKFSDALNFLWNEETKASRWVSHQIFRSAFGASPITKLAILEVIEATRVMYSSQRRHLLLKNYEQLPKRSFFILAVFIWQWKQVILQGRRKWIN